MKAFLTIAALLVGVLFAFASPVAVSAQQTAPNDTYNEAPAPGNTGGTGTTTNEDRGGFDWRWLLPLLAVPLLFLFKKDNRNEERQSHRSQQFAGSKGGESRKDREEDIL